MQLLNGTDCLNQKVFDMANSDVLENHHHGMLCLAVVKLNKAQYQHLADKLMDSANIFLASLVVGQFVEQSIQWVLVVMGLVTYGVLVVVTTILRKKGGEP